MNILGPKYFTAVLRKQMGPIYRMDSKGPQSISLVDFDHHVCTKNVVGYKYKSRNIS